MRTSKFFKNGRAMRRLITLVSAGILGAALAAIVAVIVPPTYEATATVYVTSVTRPLEDGTALQQRSALVETQDAQQKTLTLASLATSDVVAERVINTLDLPMTPNRLLDRIDARALPQTVLIEISARDRSPAMAREIANTTALEFSDYAERLNTETQDAAAITTARLVDPALTPPKPIAPTVPALIALGLLAGLGVGVLVLSVLERTDARIRDGGLLQSLTALPYLGSTPWVRTGGKRNLSGVTANETLAESVKAIRTTLIQLLPDLRGRLLTIESSEDDSGKSALTLGLARAFQQAGFKVLIVDGDLRHRSLTTSLGLDKERGLADQLIAGKSAGEVIQTGLLDRIDVISAGQPSEYPSELLGSEAFSRAIEELRGHYSLVLIDTPGIKDFTDGAVIARNTDGAVLAVPFHRHDPQQVSSSIDAILKGGGAVVGTVMTLVPESDRS